MKSMGKHGITTQKHYANHVFKQSLRIPNG